MATEKVKVFEEGKAKPTPIWVWLLPLLLLLALGLWLLSRRHAPEASAVTTTGDSTKPDAVAGNVTRPTTWTAASISDAIRKDGRVAFNDTDVHFATGSAALAGDSQAVLDQAAQALKDNSNWHMQVVGHTDSVGSEPSNDQLAQSRAQSVKSYLVAHGVDAGRLGTEEKGPRQPVATNSTDSGRAENRRVELVKQ